MEEKRIVYIATPAGVSEEEVTDAVEIGNCIIINCEHSIVITSSDGEVYVNTLIPTAIEETDPEYEDDEVALSITVSSSIQSGNTDTIRVFETREEAEKFSKNALTLVKFEQACEAYKNKKN